jgi:hypothetical protein
MMLGFEHRKQRLASTGVFLGRLLRSGLASLLIIGLSLIAGIAGYIGLAHLTFVDAFLNAAMILAGMGPVTLLDNDAAKIFAGVYALYSGLLLIAVTGIVLAPVLHRVLHVIHAEDD